MTGSYQYEFLGSTRSVDLSARAGDPASGWFSYVSPFGTMSGPVTCVRVIGSDAWVTGLITGGTILGYFPAWAVRVRDGGTPGANGDMAITYVDTQQEAADFCQSAKATRKVGDMVPVTAGNLVVHAAP